MEQEKQTQSYTLKEIIEEAIQNQEDIQHYVWEDKKETILAEKLEFFHCHWQNCQCVDSTLTEVSFHQNTFQNCDFSNTDFSGSTFVKTKFVNCKLVGCNFTNCSFFQTQIAGSNCAYANLYSSYQKEVVWSSSNLTSSVISETKFHQVKWQECNLQKAQLFQTILQGIDFTTCDLSGIVVAIPDLKGVKVNEWQAIELAKLMEIIIEP